MAATRRLKQRRPEAAIALAGISSRPLAEGDQRSRLHSAELRALRRRRVLPRARHGAHARTSGTSSRSCSSRSGGKACSTSLRFRVPSPRTRPGYIDRENEIIVGLQTDAPLKRAIMPNGGFRMVLSALKAYGYEPDPHVVETFTKYRKTHNEGGLRCLHGGCQALPQLAHPHRTARRLRPRPHHRRLPARRALRRHPAHRAARSRRSASLDAAMSTDEIIRDREELSEQIRALKELQQMAAELRLRHLAAGGDRAGSRAVALLRLSGRREGTKRRGDVAGPDVDLPRHLLRARPGGRHPHRGAGPGNHRRLRHQAAHRPLSAHAGVR